MESIVIALATSLSLISLGGGLYEVSVVDPAWPKRPDIIQPMHRGISRRRFWIVAHISFELLLIASLVVSWSDADIRTWLLIALASHACMRIWSALYFIPRALRFEQTSEISEAVARAWTKNSRLRLPLDLVTCTAMIAGLIVSVK